MASAARAIKSGEADLVIAGGVESMSRAPFVMAKADTAFSRAAKIEDTTMGWRFVNPAMKAKYGTDSMPETGEIVAEEFHISREDQDAFALRSQQRAADAIRSGRMAEEITPVCIPQKKGEPIAVTQDEHPRPDTTLAALAKLKGDREAGRYGDRGKCFRRERWSVRVAARFGSWSEATWTDSARARGGCRGGRCGSTDHGHRPGACVEQGFGEGELDHRANRRDRVERSVCFAGAGGARESLAWRMTRRT